MNGPYLIIGLLEANGLVSKSLADMDLHVLTTYPAAVRDQQRFVKTRIGYICQASGLLKGTRKLVDSSGSLKSFQNVVIYLLKLDD